MGFRYRRSIRLAKGLRINLSKSGPSLSVGGRGLAGNFGPRGTRATVGLPGTGLSYSVASRRRRRTRPSALASLLGAAILIGLVMLLGR